MSATNSEESHARSQRFRDMTQKVVKMRHCGSWKHGDSHGLAKHHYHHSLWVIVLPTAATHCHKNLHLLMAHVVLLVQCRVTLGWPDFHFFIIGQWFSKAPRADVWGPNGRKRGCGSWEGLPPKDFLHFKCCRYILLLHYQYIYWLLCTDSGHCDQMNACRSVAFWHKMNKRQFRCGQTETLNKLLHNLKRTHDYSTPWSSVQFSSY